MTVWLDNHLPPQLKDADFVEASCPIALLPVSSRLHMSSLSPRVVVAVVLTGTSGAVDV